MKMIFPRQTKGIALGLAVLAAGGGLFWFWYQLRPQAPLKPAASSAAQPAEGKLAHLARPDLSAVRPKILEQAGTILPETAKMETPEAISDVQQSIQEVLKAQEKIKAESSEENSELQRITEQAQVHRKILHDLEETGKNRTYGKADVQELLRQEKIRLIQEQTLRNMAVMENLNRGRKITPEQEPAQKQNG